MLEEKAARLERIVRDMGAASVAYSGGIDSALLLRVCHDILGDACVALTARSAAVSEDALDEAALFADSLGVTCIVVETQEVTLEGYRDNPPDRCFHCRHEMYGRFQEVIESGGLGPLVDGTTADDLGDHRPGMRAANQHGVRQPLREAGFTKADIRAHARALGIPIWDKPQDACLSSRFPYGERIDAEKLQRVARAEKAVRAILGSRNLRVRSHDRTARLELDALDIPRAVEHREAITRTLKAEGYVYVTLDLEGFRSGSMNEALRPPSPLHGAAAGAD